MAGVRHKGKALILLIAATGMLFVVSAGAAYAGKGGKKAKATTASSNGDTRGASPSQPDQDGKGMDRGLKNGDADKPPSGDGNNGCGNDADREDDNNGWCGRPPFAGNDVDDQGGVRGRRGGDSDVRGSTTRRTGGGVLGAKGARRADGAQVLGTRVTRGTASETEAAVLGTQTTRGGVGSRLAMTGASLLLMALGGLLLTASGVIMARKR